MAANLHVTLKKSVVSTNPDARRTVRALGLHRIGETVELPDNPAVRGQIRAVRYMLEVAGELRPAKAARAIHRPAGEAEPAAGAGPATAAEQPAGEETNS